MMKKLILSLLCTTSCALFALVGCAYEQPSTPAEQEAQEFKMRELLNDTSPRNMNDQPKATQEFKRTYDLDKPGTVVPNEEVMPESNQYKDRPTAEGDSG